MNARTQALCALTLAGCAGAVPAPVRAPTPAPAATVAVASPTPPTAPPVPTPVRVMELRNADSPLVTVRVVFEAGSADDPAGREGLTRLLARLMVEGGTEALTYEALTRQLFPLAARLDYHVDRDMTVFTGQVHRDHIARFYALMRDVLLHPRLADEDLRRVRTQSLADLTLDLRGSNDEALGKEYLQSLVYTGHPYGHPAVGTETGLSAITLDDVRAQRARVFCRNRVLVGLAGAYPESLAETVRADLAALPDGCAPPATLPVASRPHGLHVVIIDKPAASSTAVSAGLPLTITRADADFPAVQFVTDYLGLHRQSVGVLYQSIREARGLNYGDYAYAEHFVQEEDSRFPRPNVQRRQQYASLWLRPVPPAAAHFALRAALRAVDHALAQDIPDADFGRVRSFLDGYVTLSTQTESSRLGYALDDAWMHATGGSYARRMQTAWDALTPAGTRTAAARYLSATDAWVVLVAPNARALADAIAHDTPSPVTYDSPKPPEVMAEDAEIASYPLHVAPENVRVIPLAEVFH